MNLEKFDQETKGVRKNTEICVIVDGIPYDDFQVKIEDKKIKLVLKAPLDDAIDADAAEKFSSEEEIQDEALDDADIDIDLDIV